MTSNEVAIILLHLEYSIQTSVGKGEEMSVGGVVLLQSKVYGRQRCQQALTTSGITKQK